MFCEWKLMPLFMRAKYELVHTFLTHFRPGFPTFSRDIEMEHWLKMNQ